jgi:hypothetical protein
MKQFTVSLYPPASRYLSIAVALGLLIGSVATSPAATVTVYNSIPATIPPDVASEGPEAYAFSELGDGFTLSGQSGRTLDTLTIVMSSWACTSGNWYSDNCMTTTNATYPVPITVNIYSVTTGASLEGASPEPAPGTLLGTLTQTFNLPYRPSQDTVNCDDGQWYETTTQSCSNGIAVSITFNLLRLGIILPSQVIVGIQYNTSDYGPAPYGDATACHSTSEGCFYDALNISTDSDQGAFTRIGSVLDVSGIFVDYTNSANACQNTAATGVFGLDASPGCWTGYHPEMTLTAR